MDTTTDTITIVNTKMHVRRQTVEDGVVYRNTSVTIEEQVCSGGKVFNSACLIKKRIFTAGGERCEITDNDGTVVLTTIVS